MENIITPSNVVEAASSGQAALFERRAPSVEIDHRVFKDKRNSILPSEEARFIRNSNQNNSYCRFYPCSLPLLRTKCHISFTSSVV